MALAAVALLTGCGAASESEPTAESSGPDSVGISVDLLTTSVLIGGNDDDKYCAWRDPKFVLRDGEGEILAADEVESLIAGEASIGGEPAQLGKVESADPYTCVLSFSISDVDPVKFFELEVTTKSTLYDEEFSEKATFSREDTQGGTIELEFTG